MRAGWRSLILMLCICWWTASSPTRAIPCTTARWMDSTPSPRTTVRSCATWTWWTPATATPMSPPTGRSPSTGPTPMERIGTASSSWSTMRAWTATATPTWSKATTPWSSTPLRTAPWWPRMKASASLWTPSPPSPCSGRMRMTMTTGMMTMMTMTTTTTAGTAAPAEHLS